MKTAVIGNSHTLTIRSAFSKHPAILGQVDFYFIRGAWEILRKENNEKYGDRLINLPKIGESDRGIDLADYDGFVVAACGWWAARNENVESGHHPLARMACANWEYDRNRVPPEIDLVSEEVFRLTVESWVREQPIIRLAAHISNHYQQQLILLPWPAPNRVLTSDPSWVLNRWYGSKGPSAWFDYFKAQQIAVKNITKEMNGTTILLDYPLPEPTYDGFMGGEWCDTDPFHGNERYGSLVLNQIIEVLNSRT